MWGTSQRKKGKTCTWYCFQSFRDNKCYFYNKFISVIFIYYINFAILFIYFSVQCFKLKKKEKTTNPSKNTKKYEWVEKVKGQGLWPDGPIKFTLLTAPLSSRYRHRLSVSQVHSSIACPCPVYLNIQISIVNMVQVITESVTSQRHKYNNFYPPPSPCDILKKSVIHLFLRYLYLIHHTSERQAGDFHMP